MSLVVSVMLGIFLLKKEGLIRWILSIILLRIFLSKEKISALHDSKTKTVLLDSDLLFIKEELNLVEGKKKF